MGETTKGSGEANDAAVETSENGTDPVDARASADLQVLRDNVRRAAETMALKEDQLVAAQDALADAEAELAAAE